MAAIVAAVGAWVIGSHIRSPAEAAADASEPSPSVITADVELRRITRTIVAQARVTTPATTDISVTAAAGAERLIVSMPPPRVGDTVTEGQALSEVSGRPVFTLEGAIPSYRTLVPGVSGSDVLQLQNALARLGYEVTLSGRFDAATSRGIAEFYAAAGYEPVASGSHGGVEVPIDEIAYVRELPAVVVNARGRLGNVVDEKPIISVASGEPIVEADLTPVDAAIVEPGQAAKVQEASGQGVLTAHVIDQARSHADGEGNDTATVRFTIDSRGKLPESASATVTMVVRLSNGPVLSVPIGAIWSGPDGADRITVMGGDQSQIDLAVTAGVSGDGYVELESVSSDGAKPGDHVVVW